MSTKAGERLPHGGQNSSPSTKETLLKFLLDDLHSSGLPIHQQDIATLLRRSASEGPKFIFHTLKEISSMTLATLETGHLPAQTSFACLPGTKIPRFLGGLWSMFLTMDGALRSGYHEDAPAVQAVAALLQIGSLFSKYAESFPKDMIPATLDEFVAVDASLHSVQLPDDLLSAAANIVTVIFSDFSLAEITPKHGPGAVATGERQEKKWRFKRRFASANAAYPSHIYLMAGWDPELEEHFDWWDQMEETPSGTAKILVVPKTSTSVRIISSEPLELMFFQQGQMTKMIEHLERHPFSKGRVNFTSQSVNRNLALVNSATKNYATIDLSAASDRLGFQLVKRLFTNCEDNVWRFLEATRSTHTKLPDGRIVELQKFAPMGSAVCFPTQSISFFALCVAAISMAAKVPASRVMQMVYIFGDDIIVPTEYVQCVSDALTSVGLKVNLDKSFANGWFRESCGMFALNGVDITPVRFKTTLPLSKWDGRGISAWLTYAHECETRGYRNMAEYIYITIEKLVGKLPYGYSSSSYFCRKVRDDANLSVHNMDWPHKRWNKTLHRTEIKAYGLGTRYRDVEFDDGWQRLLRNLLTSFRDSDPGKAVVPNSAKTKLGWHSV